MLDLGLVRKVDPRVGSGQRVRIRSSHKNMEGAQPWIVNLYKTYCFKKVGNLSRIFILKKCECMFFVFRERV